MLSVIIPTLNEEKFLPFLFESIKKQSFTDYEIIVADAGSKDKTLEIARKYSCKIVSGGLPAKGRNEGAKIARGDLFLFLDAETILPENTFKKALSELEDRKLDITSCGLETANGKQIYKIFYNILYNWPTRFLENVFPYASNFILIKKEIHNKIGGFDEEIKLAEDHSYVRKAAKIAKFGFLKTFKIKLAPRRFQKEGWLTISAKYYFCNLYNIFFGDVKSDIFKYGFKRQETEKKISKISEIILNILKLPVFILWFVIGFFTWILIFLIFIPKLAYGRFRE